MLKANTLPLDNCRAHPDTICIVLYPNTMQTHQLFIVMGCVVEIGKERGLGRQMEKLMTQKEHMKSHGRGQSKAKFSCTRREMSRAWLDSAQGNRSLDNRPWGVWPVHGEAAFYASCFLRETATDSWWSRWLGGQMAKWKEGGGMSRKNRQKSTDTRGRLNCTLPDKEMTSRHKANMTTWQNSHFLEMAC